MPADPSGKTRPDLPVTRAAMSVITRLEAENRQLRAALDRKNFALARAADRLNLIAGLSEPDKVEVRARWGADALSAFKAEPTLSPEAAKPLIDEELSRG